MAGVMDVLSDSGSSDDDYEDLVNSFSEDEDQPLVDAAQGLNLQPYRFEPPGRTQNNENDEQTQGENIDDHDHAASQNDEANRVGNTEW